jgi:ABC-2 type transport system permease protein
MNNFRVFFAGGLTSYRALFNWLNPWAFLSILVAYPVFQTMYFVYLGRAADTANDTFFLVGNAFVAAAVAGMFGMGQSIGGERRYQTLPMLLASPASRLALFLGRALPAVVNGFVVAVLSYTLAALMLHLHIPASRLAGIALALLASCFACAGLGLCIGSLAFRTRSISLFADTLSGIFLIVTGANVPLARLPASIQTLANYIPLTHGIHAAQHAASRRQGDTHRSRVLHGGRCDAALLRTHRPTSGQPRPLLTDDASQQGYEFSVRPDMQRALPRGW